LDKLFIEIPDIISFQAKVVANTIQPR
jgi:hypothetical protein